MAVWRSALCTSSIVITVLGADMVAGQKYPDKPIRMVTASPGGGPDFVARVLGPRLSANLGQPVVVDNRGGAGGIIAGETVAKATPDGYTKSFYGPAIWIVPFLRTNVPYDPVKDFAPITLAVSSPNILVVHPALPVQSVKELIALAKARPGQLNYGAGNAGSSTHLAAELFAAMAGVNITNVPYKSTPVTRNDLSAGELQVMFPVAGVVVPPVKSGRLRALAVTSPQPSALAPGLPTVAASGLPGYESQLIVGMFAPAKTPRPLVTRLNQEVVRVLSQTDVKEQLLSVGVETVGSSPEQLMAKVKGEMARLGAIIERAGIREK